MQIVRQLDPDIWRAFVEHHPQGQVFHTPEMFAVFARAKGHCPTLWAVVEADQVLALLLPVQVTLWDGLLRRLTTRAVVYGSVLYELSPRGEEALTLLLHDYTKAARREVLFTELRNLSDLSAVQSMLSTAGFVYEENLVYLINLDKPVDEIMAGLTRHTRKNIRGIIRKGDVIIEKIDDLGQLSACYETLRKTYENAHVPLADRSLFEAAFDILVPKGMMTCMVARVEGIYAAISLDLFYKDIAYGWYGGTDRTYGSYNPNELLTWKVLEWAAIQGYRVYDFGGAGKPDEEYGVRDFKAKFGGELVCYGRNVCIHAPLLTRVSKIGYELYRHLI